MALTATATERVRADVIKQLELRDPRVYVASFNRPNLNISRGSEDDAVRNNCWHSFAAGLTTAGIVIAQVQEHRTLARNLNEDGVSAKRITGLTNVERTKHQDAFLRDDVRVITATSRRDGHQ